MLYCTTTTKRRRKDDKQRQHRTKAFDKNIDGNTPELKDRIHSSNKDRTNNGSGGNNQTNLSSNYKKRDLKQQNKTQSKSTGREKRDRRTPAPAPALFVLFIGKTTPNAKRG